MQSDLPTVEPAAPLKVSVSQLAALKCVSPQAISKRLRRLETEGLIASEKYRGTKRVVLDEWDRVTGETTDLARAAGAAIARLSDPSAAAMDPATKADPTYTAELTRKARLDADLKQLEIDRQLGNLVRIEDVRDAMIVLAEAIVRDVDQLPAVAETVHAAAAGGLAGTREALRRCARDLRERFDRSLAAVDYSPGNPKTDGEAAA